MLSSTTEIASKLPELKDYRIRQTDVGALVVVEIGGRTDLNPNVKKQAGMNFKWR